MVLSSHNPYVWHTHFACEDNIFGTARASNETRKRGELTEGMIGEFYEHGPVRGLSMPQSATEGWEEPYAHFHLPVGQ